MSVPNQQLVERVLAKLSDRQVLARFLDQPRAVFEELAGEHGNDATLEEVGRRLRERLADDSSLSEKELEGISAGLLNIGGLSPRLGRTFVGSTNITMM